MGSEPEASRKGKRPFSSRLYLLTANLLRMGQPPGETHSDPGTSCRDAGQSNVEGLRTHAAVRFRAGGSRLRNSVPTGLSAYPFRAGNISRRSRLHFRRKTNGRMRAEDATPTLAHAAGRGCDRDGLRSVLVIRTYGTR